jgi:hypothetical protein
MLTTVLPNQDLVAGVWYKYVLALAHRNPSYSKCALEMRVSASPEVYISTSPNPILYKMVPWTISRTAVGVFVISIPTSFRLYTNRPTIIVTCQPTGCFATASAVTVNGANHQFTINTYGSGFVAADCPFQFVVISRGQVLLNGVAQAIATVWTPMYETQYLI